MEHGVWMKDGEKIDRMCRGRKLVDITQVVALHHRKGLHLKRDMCYTETGCVFHFYHIFEKHDLG